MANLSNEDELKNRIAELEAKQAKELDDLKAQFRTTYEQMQPLNLIKNALHDVVSTPQIQDDLLNAGVSLAAGYIAKKITVGSSHGVVKNILGDLVQLGVTATISKYPEEIKEITHKLMEMATRAGHAGGEVIAEHNEAVRKRLMKEIMQLTEFIQTTHPALYIILEETPLPEKGGDEEISLKSLRSYRDTLKLQLRQFGEK